MTPLETVNFILSHYNADILQNYKKIEAVFSDLCRDENYKQESNILILAVKAGVPYLLNSIDNSDEWLELKLVERLSKEYGIKNDLALGAVIVWSNAIFSYKKNGVSESKRKNNESNTKSLLKKLLSEGGSENNYLIGKAYLTGVLVKKDVIEYIGIDAKKGYQHLILASQGRNADAQNYLGYCFEQGIGVSKNLFKAFEYYDKASKKGNLHGKFIILPEN